MNDIKECYYCGGDHEDDPCPKRKADAERFYEIGLTMYPRRILRVGSHIEGKFIPWGWDIVQFEKRFFEEKH